jgi:effector-binding domain-containing protein
MNIEVVTKESELAVAVKIEQFRFDGMGDIMGENYKKLWDYLASQGKEMAGVPYCKYYNGSEDFMVFDLELGLPVSEALPEQGEFFMARTDAGRALTATYKGPYKEIEKAYGPMMEYMPANKLESTGVFYDYYVNDPSSTPEDELLTKIYFMLK